MKNSYLIILCWLFMAPYAHGRSLTKWYLINMRSSSQTIHCNGVANGLQTAIHLRPQTVASMSVANYTWHNFDNDSLGLNAAHWTCFAGKLKTEFKTKWGERMGLIIEDEGIHVLSQEMN